MRLTKHLAFYAVTLALVLAGIGWALSFLPFVARAWIVALVVICTPLGFLFWLISAGEVEREAIKQLLWTTLGVMLTDAAFYFAIFADGYTRAKAILFLLFVAVALLLFQYERAVLADLRHQDEEKARLKREAAEQAAAESRAREILAANEARRRAAAAARAGRLAELERMIMRALADYAVEVDFTGTMPREAIVAQFRAQLPGMAIPDLGLLAESQNSHVRALVAGLVLPPPPKVEAL